MNAWMLDAIITNTMLVLMVVLYEFKIGDKIRNYLKSRKNTTQT